MICADRERSLSRGVTEPANVVKTSSDHDLKEVLRGMRRGLAPDDTAEVTGTQHDTEYQARHDALWTESSYNKTQVEQPLWQCGYHEGRNRNPVNLKSASRGQFFITAVPRLG